MSRSPFGWDLPPGVTSRMIDEQWGDRPCDVCGKFPDECICPECPTCGDYGNPRCYAEHGLERTPNQVASLAAAEEEWQNRAQDIVGGLEDEDDA